MRFKESPIGVGESDKPSVDPSQQAAPSATGLGTLAHGTQQNGCFESGWSERENYHAAKSNQHDEPPTTKEGISESKRDSADVAPKTIARPLRTRITNVTVGHTGNWRRIRALITFTLNEKHQIELVRQVEFGFLKWRFSVLINGKDVYRREISFFTIDTFKQIIPLNETAIEIKYTIWPFIMSGGIWIEGQRLL